jgi:hypothetical protein
MSIQDLVLNAYLDGIHAHQAGLMSSSELRALKCLADAAMCNRSPEMLAIAPNPRRGKDRTVPAWLLSKSSVYIQ